MPPVISVENISKKYQIGLREKKHQTFREAVMETVTSPLKRFRELSGNGHADSEFWALRDVSFEVKEGEVLGIIGRNGAGKSTLLKILSRITEPTSGRAVIRGRVASLLEVGTGFHNELSGRENVYLNGAILGMTKSEIDRKFDEIVDFSGVEKFLDTAIKHYSSGMKVRLAFAVAAHLDPEILIIDEVLAVGDQEFQNKCMGKMQDVAVGGRTILFVSHNMAAVLQLCQSAILLEKGTVIHQDEIGHVVRAYLSTGQTPAADTVDLSRHPGRISDGPAVILSVSLADSTGRYSCTFEPLNSLTATLHLRPTQRIHGARIAIAIEDGASRRITTVANYLEELACPDIGNPCRVRCHIPCLRLAAGRYFLSVSIGDKYGGLMDGVLNAVSFEIEGNHYRTPEQFRVVYGPVLTESSWEIVE